MKKLLYFIPSIILMMIIFMLSHQNGEQSSGLSTQIVSWIYDHLHILISEFIIRKLAHMSEYALLTLSLIYGFYKNNFSLKNVFIYSSIISFFYACFDEFHQLFINERAGQITDVMIDSIGILFAVLFILTVLYVLKKKSF